MRLMDVQTVLRQKAAELGYEKLAREAGLHRSFVYRWLNGQSDAHIGSIEKIAVALGLRLALEEIPNGQESCGPVSLSTRPSRPRE